MGRVALLLGGSWLLPHIHSGSSLWRRRSRSLRFRRRLSQAAPPKSIDLRPSETALPAGGPVLPLCLFISPPRPDRSRSFFPALSTDSLRGLTGKLLLFYGRGGLSRAPGRVHITTYSSGGCLDGLPGIRGKIERSCLRSDSLPLHHPETDRCGALNCLCYAPTQKKQHHNLRRSSDPRFD